eukprot:9471482-Pyramimonas_sp.AAC.3
MRLGAALLDAHLKLGRLRASPRGVHGEARGLAVAPFGLCVGARALRRWPGYAPRRSARAQPPLARRAQWVQSRSRELRTHNCPLQRRLAAFEQQPLELGRRASFKLLARPQAEEMMKR